MSASLGLYRLQLVDSSMDEIHQRLDKIQQILDNDEASRQVKRALTEAATAFKLAAQQLKLSEQEVEKQKTKIAQSEASLYGGAVKNPKELQDLQLELAALKRHLTTLEDRQLEAMETEEAASQRLQDIQAQNESLQEKLSGQFKILEEERSTKNKDLERLKAERLAAMKSLEPNFLALYDELRQERNGVAVVLVNDGACSACGTTLTPSQQQNARSTTQIMNCPTCGRILFAN
jgi:predicted  nucleic acid-binding Zn-ribbon protein